MKLFKILIQDSIDNQNGSFAIMTGILIFIFIGMAALAIDIGHIAVVKNELQNAADAGALAGANVLYIDEGKTINPNANQVGRDAAIKNRSQKIPAATGIKTTL